MAAGESGGRRAACCIEEIIVVCKLNATFCKDRCNSSCSVTKVPATCVLALVFELETAVSMIARMSDILESVSVCSSEIGFDSSILDQCQ